MVRRAMTPSDLAATVGSLADRLAEHDRRSAVTLGVGLNDARVLRHLSEAGDATPASIGRYLGISSAAVTALIDRLESLGLVERARNPLDRRSVTVRPTFDEDSPQAKELRTAQARILSAAERLSAEERVIVGAFLADLQHDLDL